MFLQMINLPTLALLWVSTKPGTVTVTVTIFYFAVALESPGGRVGALRHTNKLKTCQS